MQRRRRSKAVPRDIFGNPTTPSSTTKQTTNISPPQTEKPTSKPPAKPPAKSPDKEPEKKPNPPDTVIVPKPKIKEESIEETESDIDAEVINEQILRTPRKSIGLRPSTDTVETESVESVSNRAKEIIDESKERAKTEVVVSTKPAPRPVTETKAPPKPKPRPRRRSNSFQPANRAKRLDRSRHMEYKYEMRGLLQDLDIPEEFRSNILGTIWARGERQTAAEAKQFISEKTEQGVLNDEQESTLKGVVDRYTVRR